MNIKAAIRYQRSDYLKTVRNFYMIIVLIIVLFVIAVELGDDSSIKSFGGIEMSTLIFLFVVGLNSFRETFLMMLQNGVSRKTMFISTIVTILSTSTLMAIVDRFLLVIGGLYSDLHENVIVTGMYDILYGKRSASMDAIPFNLEGVLIIIGIYISAMAVGLFITTAYYRMNKVLKIVVSVGVPATVFVFLPVLDGAVFGGRMSRAFIKMMNFILGGTSGTPYNLLLSCIIFTIVCFSLTWMLVRRAVEKIN